MSTPLPKMPHPITAIEPNSDENRPPESNEELQFCKCLRANNLQSIPSVATATEQSFDDMHRHEMTCIGTHLNMSIKAIADAWPSLQPHIREAILTLATCGPVDHSWSAGESP